jgi:hypothetical protein
MNQFTWWDENIMASIKPGGLTPGKRFEGIVNFYKVMTKRDAQTDDTKEDILAAMPKTFIWAPSLTHAGQVFRSNMANGFDATMYLSPNLEFEPQPYINFVVAHEFAHIALRHHQGGGSMQEAKHDVEHRNQPHEQDADALAESWGFKRTNDKWLNRVIVEFAKSLRNKPRLRKKFVETLGINALKKGKNND